MDKFVLAAFLVCCTGIGIAVDQKLEAAGLLKGMAQEMTCEEAYDFLIDGDDTTDMTMDQIEALMPERCK